MSDIPAVFAAALGVTGAVVHFLYESKNRISDNKEIKDEVNHVIETFGKIKQQEKDDVLTFLLRNVAESKEYYILNKQQARKAFSTARWISILGFFLFTIGIFNASFTKESAILTYSSISGAIIEIVAGLFFWLYKQSLQQLNLFHESLRNTEKFLTAIKLVDYATPQNRDSMYAYIIQNIFGKPECKIELKSNERDIRADVDENDGQN